MVPGAGPDTWRVLLLASPGDTQWLKDKKQDGRSVSKVSKPMGQVGPRIQPDAGRDYQN